MKKIVRLTESDLIKLVKRTINEMDEDNDLFQEDYESLMIEISHKLKPFYNKYGLEGTLFLLEGILDGIHEIGDEYFGE
jgi:hypothetical protein